MQHSGDLKDSPSTNGANIASIVEQKGACWKVDHTFVKHREIQGYSAILSLIVYGSPIGRLDTMSGSS